MKAIINGKIILPNKIVKDKVLLFDKTIIGIVDEVPNDIKDFEIIDAKDNYVSPGLIDIHIHGNVGHDFMTAKEDEIVAIEKAIASNGVTGYLATTMTMSQEDIYSALDRIDAHKENGLIEGAKLLGVHLEGPFINEAYKGAQDPDYIIPPSYEFIENYKDLIKIITYAPEKDSGLEFTQYISKNTDIILSMGHTNATYNQTVDAIDCGAKHVTHLFNAMTPLNHRNPGVVGASLINHNIKCELIADTIHVNKDLFEMLVRVKGLENLILVTDSMEAGNMPDGIYTIGGNQVKLENGAPRLVSNGALAGSVLNLNTAVKNIYNNTTLSLNEAIQLASLTPAKALNIADRKGSLEVGKDSDIAIFDKDLNCLMTIVEGSMKHNSNF